MAPIVPAGKRKFDWAPDLGTLSKRADTDEEVMTGEMDELDQFEAIKDLPDIKDSADELSEVVMAVEEAAEAAQKAVDAVKEVVDHEASENGEEGGEKGGEEGGEEDIVINIADEKPCDEKPCESGEQSEVVLDIMPETDGVPPGVKEDGKAEVEKESSSKASAQKKTEPKKESKWSSDSQKFVRMSSLSPQNRKELGSYWTALGFPPEYVQAMLKDYEA